MIPVELPEREPWPRWRVLAFSAALSDLANLIGNPYLRQLITAIETGRLGGTAGEA